MINVCASALGTPLHLAHFCTWHCTATALPLRDDAEVLILRGRVWTAADMHTRGTRTRTHRTHTHAIIHVHIHAHIHDP
jgi:hypothetical protein